MPENETIAIDIIIPCFNEQGSLDKIFQALVVALEPKPADLFRYNILFVDDGSRDLTWQKICQISLQSNECIKISGLKLSKNFGKERAVFAGLKISTADVVVVLDADLQHPPHLIPKMLRLWQTKKCHLVEAFKKAPTRPSWSYQVASKSFYWLLEKLTGFDLSRATDFKLMSKKFVRELLKMGDVNLFLRGQVEWVGFQKECIYFEIEQGLARPSRFTFKTLLQLALIAMSSFSVFHFI